jgi:hypothetical protein
MIAGAAFVAIVVFLSGCGNSQDETEKGSGNIVKEERPVSGFSRVCIYGASELIVTQGDQESLFIEADDNLLPLIETEVSHGMLSIGPKDRHEIRPSKPIQINLAVKKLDGITLSGATNVKASCLTAEKLEVTTSGSGKITIDALNARALTVRISGSTDCNLAGRADRQTIVISGSGSYQAGKLASQSVELTINGSGDAEVWAAETLNLNVSGSGHVDYHGRPRMTQQVSGGGRVTSLDRP